MANREVVAVEELVLWATQLLRSCETVIPYRSPRSADSPKPYREWFHKSEQKVVACLGLRMALGLPIPTDMADIVDALVVARRAEIDPGTAEDAAPLPEASREAPPLS